MNNNMDSSVYLSDKSDRDLIWDTHRSETQSVEAIYHEADEAFSKKASKMHECSTLLFFASSEDGLRLKTASFCKARTCPVCQWRRSLMWQARTFTALPAVEKDHPDMGWILLTLTVRNCPVTELKPQIKAMQHGWGKLRRRKAFKPILGYLKTLEVTRGKDGSAHPHFHILLCVRKSYFTSKAYISQAAMTDLWRECLGVSYTPVVDMRKVRRRKGQDADIHAAVLEVVKYETKLSDLTAHPDFLLEYTVQMTRVRSLELGGIMKKYMKETEGTDADLVSEDPDQDDSDDLRRIVAFDWRRDVRRYRHSPAASPGSF